jgi:hypothetical protein
LNSSLIGLMQRTPNGLDEIRLLKISFFSRDHRVPAMVKRHMVTSQMIAAQMVTALTLPSCKSLTDEVPYGSVTFAFVQTGP